MSLLAMAGITAAGEAIKWGVNRYNESKRPKFKDSEYAKEMLRRKKEGIYSPEAMNEIQGSANKQFAGGAQSGKARLEGDLISKGLGGSIAGVRAKNEYDIAASGKRSDLAGELSTEQEMSKITAADQYNQALYEDKQQSWQNKSQANQQLFSGLVDGLSPIANKYIQNGMPIPKDKLVEILGGSKDPEATIQALIAAGLIKVEG